MQRSLYRAKYSEHIIQPSNMEGVIGFMDLDDTALDFGLHMSVVYSLASWILASWILTTLSRILAST